MNGKPSLSRRSVLSLAAGTVGTITLGSGLASLAAGSVDYTYRTLQADGEVDLILDWAEFYNGDQLEAQDTPVSHDSGNPILTLENVLPGDTGRVAFGMQTAESTAAELEMLFRLLATPENGLTEPEALAGDETPGQGELAEYVGVRAWYDGGLTLGGQTIYGACNGRFEDLAESQTFEGTLASWVSDDWRPLDGAPADGGSTCLGPDEGLCLVIEWWLPEDLPGTVDNLIQGDGATLEIGFRGAGCAE